MLRYTTMSKHLCMDARQDDSYLQQRGRDNSKGFVSHTYISPILTVTSPTSLSKPLLPKMKAICSLTAAVSHQGPQWRLLENFWHRQRQQDTARFPPTD